MNQIKSVNRVFLATVIISIVGSYINSWVFDYTGNYLIILALSQLILIVPSLIYLLSKHENVIKAIRVRKISLSNVVLIILFSYLITPLMNLINALSMLYVKNDTSDIMNHVTGENRFIISLIMVALVPCILEESVYRGIFFNEYRKINTIKGILLSGFLFGIIHGNFNQFSYAFVMGIVFALMIEATDSILSTMIIHFFINGTSIFLLYLYPKLFQVLEALYGKEQFNADELIASLNSGMTNNMNLSFVLVNFGLGAIISSALAFIVFKTIAKKSGRWSHIKSLFRKKNHIEEHEDYQEHGYSEEVEGNKTTSHLITPSLVVGILICIILMISNEVFFATPAQDPGSDFLSIIRLFM